MSCPCETLWIQNPASLLGTNLLVGDICESNNINAFTRALLLALVLAGLSFPFVGIGSLIIVVLCLFFLYGRWLFGKIIQDARTVEVKKPVVKKEGFEDAEGAPIRTDLKPAPAFPPIFTRPGVAVVTRPTAANPFMNVLLDEIKYNPTRPSADSVSDPNNQIILDDFFRVQWTSDPTDVFGRTQGQRQFYTMPSTSIPNDQGSFANWLYLIPGKSFKEGNRDAAVPGTNGGVPPWLSQPN